MPLQAYKQYKKTLRGIFFVILKYMKIAACFLEYDHKFLILLRQSQKPNCNTWGLPAGKIEPGESSKDAAIRELYEETGYRASDQDLEHLADLTFGDDGNKYDITAFRIRLNKQVDVVVDKSTHSDYQWITAEDCYVLPNLIPDFPQALKLLRYIK